MEDIILDLNFKGKVQEFYNPLGPLFKNSTHKERD